MTDDIKDTSSATWKFEFADTVQADPMAKGGCLAVIRSYLNFASKTDPRAFCSMSELMLRTGLSKPAIRRAKELLIRLGYMEVLFVTEEGATMYRLVNARKQIIDDHLRIGRESLVAERRDRKRRERRMRGNETIPPGNDNGERNDTPVWNETLPNTVEEYPRDSCSEVSEGSLEEEDTFLQPPEDLTEARIWLTSICTDKSRLSEALIRLARKELTPEFIREIAA